MNSDYLRREDAEIAAVVRARTADGETEPQAEIALKTGGSAPPERLVGDHEATAMDIVQRAQRGEMSADELVDALLRWEFEPRYRTRGLADDWELRPNSFDAIHHAYVTDLIDEQAYELIRHRLDEQRPRTP